MLKVALLVWVMLGTVLAGTAVLVVVNYSNLFNQGMKWIPIAGVAGYLIALPLSLIIVKRMGAA